MTADKKQVIAHYDNCTLYNDYVLDRIISIFRDRCSVLVYLSDHGEDVYDTGDNLGRRVDSRQSYEIPFMVWCSDKYAAKHPANIKQLQSATARPAMLDNVCQLLFHLSGLQTPFYHQQRDILSPDYACPKRLINKNIDCDSLLRK